MKVIAINGSPRRDGNTAAVLKRMTEELEREGIEVETVQVGGEKLHGCTACGYCARSEGNRCVFRDDLVNETAEKMRQADGFILGTPTYYAGISGTMKCFLDRVFYTSSAYFRYKVATGFAVVRRTGGLDAVHQLQNYLGLGQTVTPPSQYWTVVYGAAKGEALQDEEGMQAVCKNARAMAWLLKVIDASQGKIPLPAEDEQRKRTNFIR